jgi:hypothetical protein
MKAEKRLHSGRDTSDEEAAEKLDFIPAASPSG